MINKIIQIKLPEVAIWTVFKTKCLKQEMN